MHKAKSITGSDHLLSQLIVKACKLYKISHITISPGSRSAPLVFGFTGNDYFKCYSVVDERCAAFFAIGIAQQLQSPTALVCTSGSALLNYYPAIAEAYYSDIPLIVISADRPPNKIDIGDGQAIRQKGVFINHIISEATLSISHDDNEQKIKNVIELCILKKGPVHLNVPFEEPLYNIIEVVDDPIKKFNLPKQKVYQSDFNWFKKKWNNSSKKMILVGQLPKGGVELKYLEKLAKEDSTIVFTETLSNIKSPLFFSSIDKILNTIEGNKALQKKMQPDILLTLGGMIVSKKIKFFLRHYNPNHHIHIDCKTAYDTYFCLTHHFKVYPNDILKEMSNSEEKQSSDYNSFWTSFRTKIEEAHDSFIQKVKYSDLYVYNCIFKTLPKEVCLQLANSSVVRYAQLFDYKKLSYCNRGTNGIEGSTSTAIGASLICDTPTVFITGDISFFYDSNALWNNYIREDFRIILINNGGGGIFRILNNENTKTNSTFNFFETNHKLKANHLASLYGFEYLYHDCKTGLIEALEQFYKKGFQPKIIEIKTPTEINDQVLRTYFKYIKVFLKRYDN